MIVTTRDFGILEPVDHSHGFPTDRRLFHFASRQRFSGITVRCDSGTMRSRLKHWSIFASVTPWNQIGNLLLATTKSECYRLSVPLHFAVGDLFLIQ